jgi:TRAP-type C4-dicarboxylate transport system permease small subunit
MKVFVRMIEGFARVAGTLGRLLGGASCLALFAMVFLNVLGRYLFRQPYIHAYEISSYFLAASVFFTLGYTLRVHGHVAVESVVERLPKLYRRRAETLGAVVFFIWAGMLTYAAWKYWLDMFESGVRSNTILNVRLWIPVLMVVIGVSLLAVEAIAQMLIRFLPDEAVGRTVEMEEV